MYDILFKHLELKITLTNEQKEIIKTFFVPKKLKKRHYLLQEGDVCKNLAFVASGLLRAYNIDEKGNEHVNQFTPEGWWTSDMYSYFSSEKTSYTIDAIEDSQILLIAQEEFENLLEKVPAMERFFRMLFQNSLVAKERRLISSHIHTAEEKYLHLMKYNPDFIERIPQNLIASYLGLTPETVSRLKKNIVFKK